MKQKYNSNKKNQKARKEHVTRPFSGKIKQLEKETVILINLEQAKPFVQECFKQRIKVGVGSVYNGGVIIYKDDK